jgi:hypothetical protein
VPLLSKERAGARCRRRVAALALAAVLLAPLRAEAAGVYTGLGFDTCNAPSASALTAWLASPYRAVGVYVGGVNRACPDGNLSVAWVTGALALGWNLIPLYVGLQAPCVTQSGLQEIDASAAGAQGTEAADDAADRAAAFALPQGSPIYFDMEGYKTNDPGCTSVVQQFVAAWVAELHARGFVAGVYGSAASTIRDLAALAAGSPSAAPDDVWIAHWNGQQSVLGDPYVPDSLWPDHQRLHQFTGGHAETYAGVTLKIDSNYLDGAVVPAAVAPPPPPPSLPSGSVATADGRASVSWPAGAFPSAEVVSLTPSIPTAPPGFAAGYAVQLSVTPSVSFAAPLTIRIAPPTAGLVPLFSSDGANWQLLPPLEGTTLPAGTQAGYSPQADGSLGIQTTQPGFFGLFQDVAPPSSPTGLSGRFSRGALILGWTASTDNSGSVASYELLLDGRPLLTQLGPETTASAHSFHPDRPTVYRLVAVDAGGNTSPPSQPVVVVPSKRPAVLPRPLPGWAWQLLVWQQHGHGGARPRAPRALPAWYWRWAAWRLQPFRIRR